MSQLQTSIELHDSDLSAINFHDNLLVVELRPAYIHKWELINGKWIGTGCVQNARITIAKAPAPTKHLAVPVQISDGMINIGEIIFDNLVPVPFHKNDPIVMKLQVVSGDAFNVSGESITIELCGESKFVEKLPEEWSPPNRIEGLVLNAIADNWSKTNLHGVNLRKCLVRPERIIALNANEKERNIWLVLLEVPETRLGYGIGYNEESRQFGLLQFTKEHEPFLIGLYGGFFDAFDVM